jgi:rhamnosyltransferase
MSNIAGVVILYFPDETDVVRNIESYIEYLSVLYIIDNTGKKNDALAKKILNFQNVIYISNLKNEGIAVSLNKAAAMAHQKNYRWLLTMDQDSFFEKEEGRNYFLSFESFFFNKEDTGVVSPAHFNEMVKDKQGLYTDLVSVLTSGNLLDLNIWKQLNGFDERLFIDEVDHEYCYRVKRAGFRVVQFNSIFLNHQLGKKNTGGYFGIISKRKRTIHSPERLYFMVRNYLYVKKKYKREFPDEFKQRNKAVLTAIKNNLFFSGKFWPNFKSIVRGYNDFRTGNFSRII